ncbi:MAG TPA: DUF1549 domain-containing protein [Isosphaeraceae bacterium]|jgi:hypothetical protein|nr:DUF1549 domain-containing protein [Isosphaeraceae bacterium]
MRRLARTLALACIATFVVGCGQSPRVNPEAPPAPKVAVAQPVAKEAKPEAPPKPKATPKVKASAPEPALVVRPAKATLAAGDPGVQFLAEGPGKHGGRRDLTEQVRWEAEPEGVVAIGEDGFVRPLKAGKATVRAVLGFEKVEAALTVEMPEPAARPWDFAADIVPILTHAGCNAGGCHGKADGQNGFHLSLFGYDPDGDHQAITRGAGGRRVSAFRPIDSLLIRKATGRTPHTGGQRITPGSDAYRTLLAWVEAGAPRARGKSHGALKDVVVEPARARLDEPGPRQLRVVARFADGHERDVTRLAGYRVNDDTVASIDPNGKAALLRRAEVDLIVRYQSRVVSTRIATLINPDLQYDFARLPRRNFIDDELYKRLADLKVPPSKPADDATFLRRVTLDLVGRQPSPEEVRDFRKDKDPDKRIKKVDRLLADRDFVRFWQIKFGDMLQISSARFGNGSGAYLYWLNDRLLKNAPWDVMVRELLTSLGNPYDFKEGGAINYALEGADAKEKAELTAQRFLGLRIRCAQCHDHPFDVWTQDDYYGLAAFFAKIKRPVGPGMMARDVVSIDPKGQVEHLRTKKPVPPRFPEGDVVKLPDDEDPRKALASWMTSPENPFFARAMANWVWAQFFGKGLADPADDLSRSNPPVHPELLDALARHFVEHKYDLRDLIRTVATSEAYGLSSATVPENAHDHRIFSHQSPRPLTAHQMADVLAEVTEVPNRFGQLGVRKAIEVNDPSTPSVILDTFGRCTRTNGCAAVAAPSLSLRQSLLLIGGSVIEEKISSPRGYLANLLDLDPPPAPEEIVENLYLRTLCRPPTDEETSHWSKALRAGPSTRDAAEDLFWALLNSREFAFNH